MKNILLFILLLGTGLLCAQTQEKSVSVMIFDVVPTHTPCQYCSELALVRADNLIYQYQDPPGAWLPYLPADVPDYVTDSTRLVEGNILVSWRDGVEVQRDTLELSGGGGDVTLAVLADSMAVKLDTVEVTQINDSTFAVNNWKRGIIVRSDTIVIPPSTSFGPIGTDEITYGDGSGGLTSNSLLLRTPYGISTQFGKVEMPSSGNFRAGVTTANSTGTGWIAIGQNAGRSNTTASYWTALGFEAGYSNISGLGWVANGYRAGYLNTTGREWFAFGFQAGYLNTTGSYWVALGSDAARGSTTGSSFVAIGRRAAREVTTGSSFVSIGLEAGRYLEDGVTGANYNSSVYIGGLTRSGEQDAVNENVFGHATVGRGSNTVSIGNDNINGTYVSSLRLRGTTTATRPIGIAGYFDWNTTTGAWDAHDGTSFGRMYLSSDATPTNGQIPVFNSTTGMKVWTTPSFGTMSSWTLAADTGTSATIDDAETVTFSGGEGMDTQIIGNTVTNTLDLSEIPAQTALGGNEYFAIYDVINGNQLTHIDTLASYLVGGLGVYGGSGTVPNNTVSTLPDGGNITYTDENLQLNPGNLSVSTDALEIELTGSMSIDGTLVLVGGAGSGAQKITVSDSGIVGFSSDDRALINTQTTNRAVMFDGSNGISEFPMEVDGPTVDFTQSTQVKLPAGTTAERATPEQGDVRVNETTGEFEGSRDGVTWENFTMGTGNPFAEFFGGYSTSGSSTITPERNIFIQANMGAATSYTLTIDDSSTPTGAYMDVINSGSGDLVLDRSTGSFVTLSGAPATITLTDETARFIFSGSSWYQIHY